MLYETLCAVSSTQSAREEICVCFHNSESTQGTEQNSFLLVTCQLLSYIKHAESKPSLTIQSYL